MPFGFAGGFYDTDTKLVRYGARDYDPAFGRWLARDPAQMEGGTNFFLYASGEPVNRLDFEGADPCLFAGAATTSIIFGAAYLEMRRRGIRGADKFFHCMAHCIAKSMCGGFLSAFGLGLAREFGDALTGDPLRACGEDARANLKGLSTPLGSCFDSCISLVPAGSQPLLSAYDIGL